jgi:hypothetical protein
MQTEMIGSVGASDGQLRLQSQESVNSVCNFVRIILVGEIIDD